jgi:hypothetical protein
MQEKIVNSNGTIYLSTEYRTGTPIRVFLAGIKNPIYSCVRSNGLAYIGTKWAGFECAKIEYEQDIPA